MIWISDVVCFFLMAITVVLIGLIVWLLCA